MIFKTIFGIRRKNLNRWAQNQNILIGFSPRSFKNSLLNWKLIKLSLGELKSPSECEIPKPKTVQKWSNDLMGSWSVNIEFGLKRNLFRPYGKIESSTRPYSLNPNRCFLYYAKNSNDQPVIQRAEFLPSNKIFASGNFQIQIFKTYEFHKDSYASHARIQHNIIMFN